jgi:hypothetical protein
LNGIAAVTPDHVVLCNPTGGVTLTLPAVATNVGQVITIKNLSNNAGNTCSVTPVVGATLQLAQAGAVGGAGFNVQNSVIGVISNGTSWFALNSN